MIQLPRVPVAEKAATRPRPLGSVRRLRNIPARNSGFTGQDQPLMSLVDEAGLQAGEYTVHLRGVQDVQVGDDVAPRHHFQPPAG